MDDLQRQSTLAVQKRFHVEATVYLVRAGGRLGRVVAAARQSHDRGSRLEIMSPDRRLTATMYAFGASTTGGRPSFAVDAPDGTRIGIVRPLALRADTGDPSRWELQPEGQAPLTGTDHTSFGVGSAEYVDDVAHAVGVDLAVPRSALPFDFRFGPDGTALRIRRRVGLRDRYTVEIGVADLDRRLALAQTVALSVFEEYNLLNSWRVTRRLFTR